MGKFSGERRDKGDSIAEPLVQRLEDFTNDLGEWVKINNNTRRHWAKKGTKNCPHTELMFKESARRYSNELFHS